MYILLVVFGIHLAAGLSDKGVIYLDDVTFDKVVDRSRDVFVRFDKEYPWGAEHDAFKELAATVGESDTQLLVVGVPLSNSETYPVNPKLSARYGFLSLKDSDFPRYKLFRKGVDTVHPIDYTPKNDDLKNSKKMLEWIVQQTGVFIGIKGQVKELDTYAKSIMAAAVKERKNVLSKAQAAADAVDTSSNPDASGYVEYYIKTMQRVLDKGESYIEQETKRLTKMSEDKAVAAAKRETFLWRLNILSSFSASADKAEL